MYAKPSQNATGPLAGMMPRSFLARLPTVVPGRLEKAPTSRSGVNCFSTNPIGIGVGGRRQIIQR